jgi:hypothetical protein
MNYLVPFLKQIIVWTKLLPELDVSERLDLAEKGKAPWLEPANLITLINGWLIAEWAIQMNYRLLRQLPAKSNAGRKPVYSDSTILVTVIIMRVWRKGYESFTSWLARNPALAQSLGYTQRNDQGQLLTISSSQLSRRTRELGYLPFILFFVALVWQLMRLGAIKGNDLVLDSSMLKAWYHEDCQAKKGFSPSKGYVFGYKIHTLVCRHLVLPVFFWVTPAQEADNVWAIPLLVASRLLYGFEVVVVRADAIYYTKEILLYIIKVLGAVPLIDYNVRRQNKQLTTLGFISQWDKLLGPRNDIERHFAWVKRYFGLKYFQVEGWQNVMVYATCTYIAVLAVAIAAYRCQRHDLARSRTNILAWT